MKRYLICYRNKRGEILTQKVWAKNQAHAIEKLKLEKFEVLAITNLKIKEKY